MSSNITINAIPSNFVDLTAGATVFKNGTFYNGFSARGKCKYLKGTLYGWPSDEPIIWPEPHPDDVNYAGYNTEKQSYKETPYGLLKNATGIVCFSFAKSINFDKINKIRITVVSNERWSSASPGFELLNTSKTREVTMVMDGYGTIMSKGTYTRTFDVSKIKGYWFVNFYVAAGVEEVYDPQEVVSRNSRGATEMVFLG